MSKTYVRVAGQLIDTSIWDMPNDRVFRDAWDVDTSRSSITIDMSRAREIWRDKIRQARASEFSKLDTEFMMALERGQDTKKIVERKQKLRDATKDPAIESAKTPAELMKVKPAGLEIE